MMVPPPRPAPSADGWSSGENQFDVFNQHQQQQQQQQHHQQQQQHHQQQQQQFGQEFLAAQQQQAAYAASQAAYNSQWNIGASEFVPKYVRSDFSHLFSLLDIRSHYVLCGDNH
jgi:hypothetical protein